jgi:hypothetical protein
MPCLFACFISHKYDTDVEIYTFVAHEYKLFMEVSEMHMENGSNFCPLLLFMMWLVVILVDFLGGLNIRSDMVGGTFNFSPREVQMIAGC